jgi:hypothetical protein
VVGGEADAERVERSLHGADGKRWAAHVFEQHQPAAGMQDPGASATARRSSGIVQSPNVMITVSKLWSSNSSACASPIRGSTSRPMSSARFLAISSIWGLSSMAVR